jgi:hypothetical protein
MSNEHSEMKLPEGKTCGDCVYFARCSKLVGAKEDWTSCDFHPRQYALNARASDIGNRRLQVGGG